MKWRRFVTGMRLSKLLRGLMLLALIKLCLLAAVSWQILDVPTKGAHRSVIATVTTPAVARAQESMPADTQTAEEKAKQGSDAGAERALAEDNEPELGRAVMLRRKEELDRQERDLKALEQKLTIDMAELERKRALISRMLEEAKSIKDKKDRHLIDVFSNMKAKQPAQVLETMDERQAVKILSGMRGRQAGEILTFVTAKKAARLAERLTRLQIPFE